jgi:hypothetical protein
MSETLKETGTHLLATTIWLVLMTFLGRGSIPLWLGALAGTFLLDIDHLIYWFYLRPERQDSKIARMLWEKRDFKGLLFLIARYHDTHTQLIFHTVLFQVILLVLTFYFFTAGDSYFGVGLVAAINIHLFKDEWEEYFKGHEVHLNNWLFWQIKARISLEAQKIYLIVISFLFALLSLLLA